jgi:hypothetical protein
VLVQVLTEPELEVPGAQRLEDLVGVGKVRFRLLDGAPQSLEDRPLRADDLCHPPVNRQPAEGRLQATRSPWRSRPSGWEKIDGSSARPSGARRSGPATAESIRATSSTVLGQRSLDRQREPGRRGRPARHPAGEGRKPTTLFQPAGLRRTAAEVAAVGDRVHPQARATAAPPELPPLETPRS